MVRFMLRHMLRVDGWLILLSSFLFRQPFNSILNTKLRQKTWVTPTGSRSTWKFENMPILSAKDNPPSKSFEGSILEKEGTWWVAKVKPRQEKAFAFDLLAGGIDYYLPFYEKKSKRRDGKLRKSTLILFPSYVPFVSDKPYSFLNKNRVATILPIENQDKFRSQLNLILTLNSSTDMELLPLSENIEFKVGDFVKVTSGPLIGLFGKIAKIKNDQYLFITTMDPIRNLMICIVKMHLESCQFSFI
jgi:hypothetical protein